MKKILINFAHPAKKKSKINMALRRAVENIEGVIINDLYSNYPDFLIDVEKEQKLCEENDIIIFQHPFYWYSAPAIIREWQDLVLEHGWAYGSKGIALKDKIFLQALSAGGDNSTYQKDGFNAFTVQELTSPFKATAHLCKMNWLPPFCIFGVHRGLEENKMTNYSEAYRRTIIALRDDTFDIEKAQQFEYLNKDLNSIIKGA
jgi:glutathione-regulated potassium-efflux system ancillary protein KefG